MVPMWIGPGLDLWACGQAYESRSGSATAEEHSSCFGSPKQLRYFGSENRVPMATPFSYTATGSFELGPRLPLDTLWGWGLQQESRTSWRASQPLKVGFDQCFFGWLGYFSFTITSPCKNWWCFTMFQSNKDINIPIFLIQLKYVIGVICPVCPKWPACFWYPPGSPSGRL